MKLKTLFAALQNVIDINTVIEYVGDKYSINIPEFGVAYSTVYKLHSILYEDPKDYKIPLDGRLHPIITFEVAWDTQEGTQSYRISFRWLTEEPEVLKALRTENKEITFKQMLGHLLKGEQITLK